MKKRKCTNNWQKNYQYKCGYYDDGNCTRKSSPTPHKVAKPSKDENLGCPTVSGDDRLTQSNKPVSRWQSQESDGELSIEELKEDNVALEKLYKEHTIALIKKTEEIENLKKQLKEKDKEIIKLKELYQAHTKSLINKTGELSSLKEKIEKTKKQLCQTPECCETHGKGYCICGNCRLFLSTKEEKKE